MPEDLLLQLCSSTRRTTVRLKKEWMMVANHTLPRDCMAITAHSYKNTQHRQLRYAQVSQKTTTQTVKHKLKFTVWINWVHRTHRRHISFHRFPWQRPNRIHGNRVVT
jgi:hypothetical protein